MKKILSTLFLLFLFLGFTNSKQAQAEDKVINMGMSTALTGPAQFLGNNMKAGVDTYFQEINAKGGVNGQKLNLITLDDAYEAAKTAQNVADLIDKNKVFGLIGNVGTPNAVPAIKICNLQGVPFFAPFTGSGILRNTPPDKYVFNYRASYSEETKKMVSMLINEGIKPNEIAFFIQNDAYGESGLKGGTAALAKYEVKATDITVGKYERNTVDIANGLNAILSAPVKPKAIIMVGAYAPCSAFIVEAKNKGLDAKFLNVSFVGSKALGESLAQKGEKYTENVIVTQVVPTLDSSSPIVAEYKSNFAKYYPNLKPSYVSLEGYIAAKLFAQIVSNAGSNLTRDSFVSTAENLKNYDIGTDTPLNFSNADHQASHQVWVTKFNSTGVEVGVN